MPPLLTLDQERNLIELAEIAAKDGRVLCYQGTMLRFWPKNWIPKGWRRLGICLKSTQAR